MPHHPRRVIPASLRQELLTEISLLERGFQGEELRARIHSLAPSYIHHQYVDTMPSPLDPDYIVQDRILMYFLRFPRTPITETELMLIAGREDWAQLVRTLRVKHGWPIVRGLVIGQLQAAGEIPDDGDESMQINADDYMLVDTVQDYQAAYRGYVARDLRRDGGHVRSKLLDYFRDSPGRHILGDELRQVANYSPRWALYVRELREDLALPLVSRYHGRPELPVGIYVFE